MVLRIWILTLHLIIQHLQNLPLRAESCSTAMSSVPDQSAGQKLSLVVHFSGCSFLSLPFQAARCCPSLSQFTYQHWSKQQIGHCPAWTELNTPGIRQDNIDGELETIPKAVRSENFCVLAFMSVSYISLSPNTFRSSGNRFYLRF